MSFGKRPSEVLLSRALAKFLIAPRRMPASLTLAISISASTAKYHRSSTFISANSAMCSRYDLTQPRTASLATDSLRPLSRQAITILAARRLRSHSQGAGSVSSRSLRAKMICLSGVARPRKFTRWESPPHCTRTPIDGEGGCDHAAVAKGKEFGKASFVGLQYQADRVRPVVQRIPLGMRGSRTLLPQSFAHRR